MKTLKNKCSRAKQRWTVFYNVRIILFVWKWLLQSLATGVCQKPLTHLSLSLLSFFQLTIEVNGAKCRSSSLPKLPFPNPLLTFSHSDWKSKKKKKLFSLLIITIRDRPSKEKGEKRLHVNVTMEAKPFRIVPSSHNTSGFSSTLFTFLHHHNFFIATFFILLSCFLFLTFVLKFLSFFLKGRRWWTMEEDWLWKMVVLVLVLWGEKEGCYHLKTFSEIHF